MAETFNDWFTDKPIGIDGDGFYTGHFAQAIRSNFGIEAIRADVYHADDLEIDRVYPRVEALFSNVTDYEFSDEIEYEFDKYPFFGLISSSNIHFFETNENNEKLSVLVISPESSLEFSEAVFNSLYSPQAFDEQLNFAAGFHEPSQIISYVKNDCMVLVAKGDMTAKLSDFNLKGKQSGFLLGIAEVKRDFGIYYMPELRPNYS